MAMQGFISNAPAANLIGKVSDYCYRAADSMVEAEARIAEGSPRKFAGQPRTKTVEQLKNAQLAEAQKQARKVS
mgnify:CR=1 FL=1